MSDNDWIDWNPNVPGRTPAKGARIRHEYGFNSDIGRYYIHRDDAPVDPEAALVERIARALALGSESKAFDSLTATLRQQFRDDAKIALAVVRGADQS